MAVEHVQTTGPEHGDRHSPRPAKGVAEKQHAGLPELDAQPSVASSRLPEGAAAKVSAPVQVRRAHIRTPTRHRAPNQEPGRILIPGDGAAGDQRAQNRLASAAIAATRRLRPVPSQRVLALWSQTHRPISQVSHADGSSRSTTRRQSSKSSATRSSSPTSRPPTTDGSWINCGPMPSPDETWTRCWPMRSRACNSRLRAVRCLPVHTGRDAEFSWSELAS